MSDELGGCVYFLQCSVTGAIKIGYTEKSPVDRLRTIAECEWLNDLDGEVTDFLYRAES